ncbi:unnamed protein product [Protopolystoma xenopodis]|uniref:Uncharacterized protein n=1 Tax=Protopolystoma xenopodis TaxID=117903 RepID=A0A3S5AUU9_9PLAT|nr:unnamed protein product [Protopolystoma xenopodis]
MFIERFIERPRHIEVQIMVKHRLGHRSGWNSILIEKNHLVWAG